MEIKCYDGILIVECNRHKNVKYFNSLSHGKWIDINGKNHFAVTYTNENEEALKKIVATIDVEDNKVVDKYNNISIKIKEEYYKSFDCKPVNFNFNAELQVKEEDKRSVGSLASSTYDTSSSDGFPSPVTPGKKKEDNNDGDDSDDDFQYIFKKLQELEERIEHLEGDAEK